MKLNKTLEMAIKIVSVLGPDKPTGLREISEKTGCTYNYAAQIAHKLVKYQVIDSKKGLHGGYLKYAKVPVSRLVNIFARSSRTSAPEVIAIERQIERLLDQISF